jgi:DNA-binding CsgD family transcriptional regulator
MSTQEFHTLQRYAMKMLKDPDDRDELVLLAWQESIRLGPKSSMPLLVNYMKWRARENKRSIVGAHNGGKSLQDVWHHDPVSLDAAVGPGKKSLMDVVSSYDRDPFGRCVVSGFEDDLSDEEGRVAEQMVWGYTDKESAHNLGLDVETLRMMKAKVRCKAAKHLA